MRIEVRLQGLEPSWELRDHALRRMHASLSRFGTELTAVVVRISDINGPRGGVDKRCRVTVHGRHIGSSSVDELSTDAWVAVDLAADRVSHTVGRELERLRSLRRAS